MTMRGILRVCLSTIHKPRLFTTFPSTWISQVTYSALSGWQMAPERQVTSKQQQGFSSRNAAPGFTRICPRKALTAGFQQTCRWDLSLIQGEKFDSIGNDAARSSSFRAPGEAARSRGNKRPTAI